MNLKFVKIIAKGLCLDTEKRFFGTGRTAIGSRMLIFRDEVDIDRCYLMEMSKRSKKVAKKLCSPIEKRFFGPSRAGIGPGMLMIRDEVHLDPCYLLLVLMLVVGGGIGSRMLIFRDEVDIDRCYLMEMLKRSKPVAKGLF